MTFAKGYVKFAAALCAAIFVICCVLVGCYAYRGDGIKSDTFYADSGEQSEQTDERAGASEGKFSVMLTAEIGLGMGAVAAVLLVVGIALRKPRKLD